MNKLVVFGITLVIVALIAIPDFANAGSSGSFAKSAEFAKYEDSPLIATWEISISAPGQELPGTLKLEKDGEGFKGAVNTDMGEAPLKDIKIPDNSFTSGITVNVQGQTMEGTLNGKLEDGKLKGELTLPSFGAISYTGKKSEKN